MNNWDKIFKNGPSEICGRQPLKYFKCDMVSLSRPCHFEFFKGFLPQISLGPFLNNLSQLTGGRNFSFCFERESESK